MRWTPPAPLSSAGGLPAHPARVRTNNITNKTLPESCFIQTPWVRLTKDAPALVLVMGTDDQERTILCRLQYRSHDTMQSQSARPTGQWRAHDDQVIFTGLNFIQDDHQRVSFVDLLGGFDSETCQALYAPGHKASHLIELKLVSEDWILHGHQGGLCADMAQQAAGEHHVVLAGFTAGCADQRIGQLWIGRGGPGK